jgi:hypothetical protein
MAARVSALLYAVPDERIDVPSASEQPTEEKGNRKKSELCSSDDRDDIISTMQTTISNGVLELTLQQGDAGAAVTALRHVASGAQARVSIDMVAYQGGGGGRPSGAYIFQPAGPAEPVRMYGGFRVLGPGFMRPGFSAPPLLCGVTLRCCLK